MDILHQIQADILDHKIPLSDILRKAKVLASELSSEDLASWVDQELNGYRENSELPDYRLLTTSASGTWTNGYYMTRNHGVPLLSIDNENLSKCLTTFSVFQGIRSVEQFSQLPEDRCFEIDPDTTTYVNIQVGKGGYGYSELHYTVSAHNFEQILDTVRNRLLDFVLKLGKRWDPEKQPLGQDEVAKLVSVVINNNLQGGSMSAFDQKGQYVQYQFNAAGDINIDSINSTEHIATELAKFRAEIDKAKIANAISEEIATKSQDYLLEAERQVKKSKLSSVLSAIGKAIDILKSTASMAGLVTSLTKLAKVVKNLIH